MVLKVLEKPLSTEREMKMNPARLRVLREKEYIRRPLSFLE